MKFHSFSLLIVSLLSTGTLCAAPVSRSEALLSLRTFLLQRGIQAVISNDEETCSTRTELNPPYHIFNIGNDEGFVIIAGDDRARPVLGYSLSGSLDAHNLPTPCEAWLRHYSEEITSLSESTVSSTRAETVDYPTTPVQPILITTWDQEAPYNLDCPRDAQGRPYATGCVATAVAQIMYHYGYPERAKGSVSYMDSSCDTVRTLNFADYPAIEWEKMTPTYGIGASSASCLAVASLMKAVGYASQMQYGYTSIAYNANAMRALINNFSYDPNIHKYDRNLLSDREWSDIILDELYAGRPVLYDGYNAEGGHTFVCDGYDGNGYFHINWGWTGLSDGYYALSALDPIHQSTGGTSSGYNQRQTVYTHIAPPDKFTSVTQTECRLDISSMFFHSENGFTLAEDDTTVTALPDDNAFIFLYAYNKGLDELSGDICMAIVDGDSISPVYTRQLFFLQPDQRADMRFWPIYSTLSDGSVLPEGTYRMGFFYRPEGTDSWAPVRTSYGAPTEFTLTIEPNRIIMSTGSQGDNAAVETILTEAPAVSVEPGLIRIKSSVEISSVSIYDMNGRLSANAASQGDTFEISTDSLSRGIYFIHILTADGRTKAMKVIL